MTSGITKGITRKSRGYWSRSPEHIEAEARHFYITERRFSRSHLRKKRRYDLIYAIKECYPGSFKAIKEKLEASDTTDNLKKTKAAKKTEAELSINPNQEEINKPYIMRGKRNQIIWCLSNNTLEENEQIGIRNVQALLLERILELRGFVSELGIIPVEYLEQAKRLIIERCGRKDDFSACLGSMMLRRQTAPYFQGSHITALQKSVFSWGLQLNLAEFDKKQVYFKKMNKEEIIRYCQELFLGVVPAAEDLLNSSDPVSAAALKELILSKIRTRKSFDQIISQSLIRAGRSNIFEGSLLLAAREIFEPWGIQFDKEDFYEYGKRPGGYWARSPERIEEAARIINREEGKLSKKNFLKRNAAGLYYAITHSYPGGMQALKDKLGISSEIIREQEMILSEDADEALGRLIE